MGSDSWLPRSVLERLLTQVRRPFVSVLIGPRQVGKTVLLQMLMERLELPTTYLDAENPDDSLVLRGGMRSLIAQIGVEPQVVTIDEFHRLPDAPAPRPGPHAARLAPPADRVDRAELVRGGDSRTD